MRQGVVLPETPRERRDLDGLEQDLRDNPLKGRALPLRLRNFRPDAGSYLASLGGPRPYMAQAARDRGADGRARAGARGGVRGARRRPGGVGARSRRDGTSPR